MFDRLIDRWWIIGARGLVAIVFGLMALFAPAKTLVWLVSLFGVFAAADGVFAIGAGLALNWFALFSEGVVGVTVGIVTYFFPAAAFLWFTWLIASWAILTGLLELAGAFRLRRFVVRPMVRGEWLLGAIGILSLALAVAMSAWPPTALVPFMWMLGGYALLTGVLFFALSLTIRHWPRAI
jgi:uncharacterized membrane protein HdeD (DUF308 family)